MIQVKGSFAGGMNLDDSFFSLRPDSYVDGLNITRDAIEANQDLAITNMVGNRIVSYTLPVGTNKCIGAISSEVRNTVIYFIWNSNGQHLILEYNGTTRTITKILENLTDSGGDDILGFTENNKITSINIYPRPEGDLLFFLDSVGRPTTLNITRFKAGEYTPVTREIINVAVDWPSVAPTCIYDNDTTVTNNNLSNKLFKFQQVWVYDEFQESVPSPESAIPLPSNILNPVFTNVQTNNNVIRISLNSGPKNVKSIKLLMSYVEKQNIFNDFVQVITIDKAKQSIDDNTTFLYSFYNDGVYPIYDTERRIQLFDDVPLLANAQEMPNGNVLTYAGITKGYNNDLVPNVTITINTVAAGSGGTVGSLNAISSFINHTSGRDHWRTDFSGVPAVGTVVFITLKSKTTGLPVTIGTYTTVSGDVASTVAAHLGDSMISLAIASNVFATGNTLFWTWNTNDLEFPLITSVTPPTTTANANSIATWPFFSQRRIGLVYFDEQGRTNGVVYNSQMIFPNYNENGSHQVLVPYINAKIYHVPPDWAYSYAWVCTKENTQYLYFETVAVNTTESGFLYFDITNLPLNQKKSPTTAAVISWTAQDGDRMRLIRRMSDGFVYGPSFDIAIEGIVVDPKINQVTTAGTFVKIKKVAPFAAELYTSNFFVIQLYRPQQQAASGENEVYYEFAQNYQILDPTTVTRRHAGMVTDQSADYVTPAEFNFYNGDAYLRPRTVVLSETGAGTFNVQDRNFVDFYISAVNDIDGRPNAIDPNAKQAYYSTLIQFSGEYDALTNIDKLNRFKEADSDEYDYSFGDVKRLKVRDRYMRVFQKLKVGVVPIFNQISKNATGEELLVVTDKLLNPIQYYEQNVGIGDNAESLASYNYADYFTSNIRGWICRVSQDGIIPISVLYKVNSWANDHLPPRTGNYKVYGSYDPKLNNYIAALEATDSEPAFTLTFDEETNSFDSFLSFHPEMMVTLGTALITFKNGQLYTHDSSTYNQFYGVDYESTVTMVFNELPLQKKSWLSISENANNIWDCPLIYGNVNTYQSQRQETNLIEQEFQILEGMPHASIKRDVRSYGGKINGGTMKGNYVVIKFRKQTASELNYLSVVSVKHNDSPLTNK